MRVSLTGVMTPMGAKLVRQPLQGKQKLERAFGIPIGEHASQRLVAHLGKTVGPFLADLKLMFHDSTPYLRGAAALAVENLGPLAKE
jgi:hypothetical protein